MLSTSPLKKSIPNELIFAFAPIRALPERYGSDFRKQMSKLTGRLSWYSALSHKTLKGKTFYFRKKNLHHKHALSRVQKVLNVVNLGTVHRAKNSHELSFQI